MSQFITSIFIICLFSFSHVFALETMSDNEMSDVVGQSGVDITLPGCEFTISFDQFAINDEAGYIVANGPLDYIQPTNNTLTLLNEINMTDDINKQYTSLADFKVRISAYEAGYDTKYTQSRLTDRVNVYINDVKNSLKKEDGGWFSSDYYVFTNDTRNILKNAGLTNSEIDSLHYDYETNWITGEGKQTVHEYDSRDDAGNASQPLVNEKVKNNVYDVEKSAYIGSVIDSVFRKSDPLEATFAQYLLGSKKDKVDFGSAGSYVDIDAYIDTKYGDNSYSTPSFKPLSIDVVNDGNKYVHIGLPTMQLIAKDLSNMLLGISNSSNISVFPLLTINVPGMVFEGHGGYLNIYPHTNGGFDLEFDRTKFYYYNQSLVIGDSSWDGVSDDHNIQFNDFLIHKGGWDGNGNRSSSFYHPFEFNGKINFDISTDANSKTWLKIEMPENTGSVYATLGEMKICGENFGTLEAGQFRILDDFKLWISGHDTGFDAELSIALESDELKYTYGTGANDYNNAQNLHIANTFTTKDNPAEPSDTNKNSYHINDTKPEKWEFSGTLNLGGSVTIRDWDSPSDSSSWPNGSYTVNQPLSIDIHTDKIVATSTIDGSLGIENVQLGGKNFGPILATGIKAWARITLHNK